MRVLAQASKSRALTHSKASPLNAYPGDEFISDVASTFNFKRRGLQSIRLTYSPTKFARLGSQYFEGDS